ncbi:MAG: sulfocyanin-like copper-binding protein [Dehalococcoidia bacterium]
MKRWMFLGLVAVAGLLWLACNDDDGGTQPATEEGAEEGLVGVILDEWDITDEETGATTFTIAAGDVTFEAHNEGEVPHELEIFEISEDVDIAALPVEAGKADPAAVGAQEIGEIEEEDLPAGAWETALFNLGAGRHLLICNIPGHYEQGMFAELTVE